VERGTLRKKTRGYPRQEKCGWVYKHSHYRGKKGFVWESQAGLRGNFNSDFNDEISSVRVRHGCQLLLFRDRRLRGPVQGYSRSTSWVGHYWNDMFSTYLCTCESQTVDVSFIENKCSFSSMKVGDSCDLYQLSDKSWNTADQLYDRARKNWRKRGSTNGWEGRWNADLIDGEQWQAGYIAAALSVQMKHDQVPEYDYATHVGILHLNSAKETRSIRKYDMHVLAAEHTRRVTPTYAGASEGVYLFKGSFSYFDAQIGAGVTSEIGYDIDKKSVKVRALGDGFTFGGETGLCLEDNCFKINFNRMLLPEHH